MPAGMQESYTGIPSIDKIPADMRIYGRTGDILELTKGRLALSRIMTNKLQQKGKTAVTDITFKYKTDIPRQPLLDPVVNSGVYSDAGTNTQLYVSDQEAVMVEPGATMVITGVWLRNNAGTLTYETTMGTNGATFAERVLVLAVSAPISNIVTITVQRGFGNPYGLSNGTPCAITATMGYILLPKSQTSAV